MEWGKGDFEKEEEKTNMARVGLSHYYYSIKGQLIAIAPQTHNSSPCPQTAVMGTFQLTQNGMLVIAMKTEMNQENGCREYPAVADPRLCACLFIIGEY